MLPRYIKGKDTNVKPKHNNNINIVKNWKIKKILDGFK
jgi:hypothetical protein